MDNLAKVEGQMVCKDGTGKRLEFFEEEFIVDSSVSTIPQARSLIRKGLIVERLRKKQDSDGNLIYPDFRAVRECQVLSLTPTAEKAEQSEMDKVLMRAIELGCVPENLDNYKRPDFRLKALQKAIDVAEKRKIKKKDDDVIDEGLID